MITKQLVIIAVFFISNFLHSKVYGQNNSQYVRIARLVVDSSKLDRYKAALKEQAETAVSIEPGVTMLYAVYEKDNPTHVNVFEIYANEAAYKAHIKTAHFLKYKATVQDMIKSLELVDVVPITLQAKQQPPN